MGSKLTQYRTVILGCCLALSIGIGLFCFGDYGIHSDDPVNRKFGIYSLNEATSFIVAPDQRENIKIGCYPDDCGMTSLHQDEHTPLLEMVLVIIEKIFAPHSTKSIYQMRHFTVFLVFIIGLIFFYKISRRYFYHWGTALLVTIFLFLSPHIFADAFYNSTDIGAFTTFIIGIYYLLIFFDNKSKKSLVLVTFFTGIAIDTRLTAILLIPLIFAFFIKEYIFSPSKDYKRNIFCWAILYTLLLILFIILFWPHLWADVSRILISLKTTFSYDNFPVENLYFGKDIPSYEIPWTYNIVWIGITTPILYLTLFIIGCVGVLKQMMKTPWKKILGFHYEIIFFAWFFVPVISAIVTHRAFYNGWRHLYFIYPALVLIAGIGYQFLANWFKKMGTKSLATFHFIIAAIVSSLCISMIHLHPYEYSFFNELAPKMDSLCEGFDKDYFHLSTKQGFEHILSVDPSPSINIFFENQNATIEYQMLSETDQKRIKLVAKADATYMFRDDTLRNCRIYEGPLLYQNSPQEIPISEIVKLR